MYLVHFLGPPTGCNPPFLGVLEVWCIDVPPLRYISDPRTTPGPWNHPEPLPEASWSHPGKTPRTSQKHLEIHKIYQIEGFGLWDPSHEKERANIGRKLKSRASGTVRASSYGQITVLTLRNLSLSLIFISIGAKCKLVPK